MELSRIFFHLLVGQIHPHLGDLKDFYIISAALSGRSFAGVLAIFNDRPTARGVFRHKTVDRCPMSEHGFQL
jgi:hypothetical protein